MNHKIRACLRAPAAAVLLLAPAAFVALPGTAVAAPQAAQSEIRNLSVNSQEGLRPGAELAFGVDGPPNGKASIVLGKSDIVVDLQETQPGKYRGSYTVRSRDRIDPTAILTARVAAHGNGATRDFTWPGSFRQLAMGNNAAPPRAAHDNSPPSVVDIAPRPGEFVSGPAVVSGSFEDRGSGVDPASVRIVLSGRDVTHDARIDAHEFSYRGELPPGRYTADVSARDFGGNTVNKTWNFEVGEAGAAADARGPLTLAVTSPAQNGLIDSRGNLVVTGHTAPRAQVLVTVEAVAPATGHRTSVAQPVAQQTVQADRDGNFTASIDPHTVPVPGTRFEVSLTASRNSQTAQQRVTVFQREG